MKNKLAKSMSMIIAIAMLISMVPAVVSAAENITEPLAVVNSDGSITVTATVAASTIDEYTLLAVRDASVYDDTTDLPATDEALEAQIEYIDQPALKDGAVSATFKLRERDGSSYGNIINVLLGGEDTDVAYTSVKIKNTAPTLSMTTTEFWANEDVVIDYSEAADWEASTVVKTVKVDGEEVSATIAGGAITIAAGQLAVGTYSAVEITDADEDWYPATLEETFTIKSRVEAAKAEAYTDITTADSDVNTEDAYELDTYTVTVPASKTAASGATITYAVEYDTANANIAVADGVYTITRHAENEISIVVKATISAEDEEDYVDEVGRTYTAKILGADGPTFTADNVEVIGTNVYNKSGKSVVIVKHEEVAATTTVKVDGKALYYIASRNYHVGIVDTDTDANIAEKISVDDATVPTPLYSGVGTGDGTVTIPTPDDFIITLRASYEMSQEVDGVTLLDEDARLLACDVVNENVEGVMDGVLTPDDAIAILRVAYEIESFAIDAE